MVTGCFTCSFKFYAGAERRRTLSSYTESKSARHQFNHLLQASTMATLSDDTLRKILVQIQQTAVQSQRNLNIAKTQIQGKERERRILQLTIEEINSLNEDVNVYKGVGKMFMNVPRPSLQKELKDEEKELADDITTLNKKAKYLEKQFNDAQGQLRDIFHNAPK
ncbi:hypothetical protein QCA50_010222 [Cerrena zonata]|uniref:Prefoldin subunit 1 n=1 Tax=Cerrena zonata TaxID=2478898 RepID=A0AAW0G9Q8_9APHY